MSKNDKKVFKISRGPVTFAIETVEMDDGYKVVGKGVTTNRKTVLDPLRFIPFRTVSFGDVISESDIESMRGVLV